MIHYRSFRNSDPPALVDIWRSQPPTKSLRQPITESLLEDLVFSKPFFENEGLTLALDGERPVGFAHAGCGPTTDRRALDWSSGATALLLVSSHPDRATIAQGLLQQSERYLRSRGAATLWGGGTPQLAPFYLGLYGGSSLPGVLASDREFADWLSAAGYQSSLYCRCFRCDVTKFRPPVDRESMQARRSHQLEQTSDIPPRDWWEAALCTGMEDRWRLQLCRKGEGRPIGTLAFWRMAATDHGSCGRALGLAEYQLEEAHAPTLTFFLSEALRLARTQGATTLEIQAPAADAVLTQACQHLKLPEVDQGLLFRRTE